MKAGLIWAIAPIMVGADVGGHLLRSGETWGNRSISAANGTAVVRIDRLVRGATIENLRVAGAYRVLEVDKGAGVEQVTMRNVHATGVTRSLARFRGPSSGLIERSSVLFSPIPQKPPHLPEGLIFEAGAHDWTVRDVTLRGAQMVMGPKRYWNGDGVATERGTRGFRFIRVTADDNSDAGFDLKGEDTWLDQVSASGNARNYRFWTSVKAGTLTVGDTLLRGGTGGTAGIWVLGDPAHPPTITIDRLVVRMTRPTSIFAVKDGAAVIRVGRCDIRAPRGTQMVTSKVGKPDFRGGPGCSLPE